MGRGWIAALVCAFTMRALAADAPATRPTTAAHPHDLDVNGDGYADVAVALRPPSAEGVYIFVYLGGPQGLRADSVSVISRPKDAWWFGVNSQGTEMTSGDVNADGYSDLMVGAQSAGDRPSVCGRPVDHDYTGRVYVYLGSGRGLPLEPSVTLAGQEPGEAFGASVSAGDVNGDGFTDLLVRSKGGRRPTFDCYPLGSNVPHPQTAGRISLFLGARTGIQTPAAQRFADYQVRTGLSPDGELHVQTAAVVGDLNGDGAGDVYLAAFRGILHPPRGKGLYWVAEGLYFGTAGGIAGVPTLPLAHRSRPDWLDRVFAADTNGDGRGDLVIFPIQGRGPMLVYRGPISGPRAIPSETVPLRWLAERHIVAHDFNGDGVTDFAVAVMPEVDVFMASKAGYPRKPIVIRPPMKLLRYGTSANVGDFNQDGFGDLAVGAFEPPGDERLYVYLGGVNGLAKEPAQLLHPPFPAGPTPAR